MNRLILLVAAALLLGGCDDTYVQNERPPYGYGGSGNYGYGGSGGYGGWGVSERKLIRNCQDAVEYRIHRKLGRDAKVRFEESWIDDEGRKRATVRGRVFARRHGDERRATFRCRMNRENGVVMEHDLNWIGGGGAVGGKRNKQALALCKERIRTRLRNEVRSDFRIEFRDPRVEKISQRMRRVTGKALLENRHGSGKVSYECKVHFEPREIYSASWRWIRRLPTGGNAGTGIKGKTARDICHNALRNRMKSRGHREIHFMETRVKTLWGRTKQVSMKVRSKLGGQYRVSHHSCKIDMEQRRILELR